MRLNLKYNYTKSHKYRTIWTPVEHSLHFHLNLLAILACSNIDQWPWKWKITGQKTWKEAYKDEGLNIPPGTVLTTHVAILDSENKDEGLTIPPRRILTTHVAILGSDNTEPIGSCVAVNVYLVLCFKKLCLNPAWSEQIMHLLPFVLT